VDEPFELHPGDLVGSFKLIQRLGAGGMGQVHLAVDMASGQDVAIKVLMKDDAFYGTWLPLFEQEQRIYQDIVHPNVVAFVTAGETAHFHFTVLEHILGMSVRAKLQREGPAGAVTTFSWMQEVMLALHAAHHKGYIHSDLKPDNVMITRDLGIKLIDFGIAKEVGEAGGVGRGRSSGPYVGTPAYSAPEALMQQPVTQRADLFAAGLLFYEMVTGRLLVMNPYEKDAILREFRTIDERGWVIDRGDERLGAEDPALLGALDGLLYGMLRFAAGERTPSTGAVLAQMERIAGAAGGTVLLLSNDESKLVAQRESADAHLWKALNLVEDGRLAAALDELAAISVFERALTHVALQILKGQLDTMVLNVKGKGPRGDDPYSVPYEGLLDVSLKLLDLCARVFESHELYLREVVLCRRMQRGLSTDDGERFLQRQMVRRPHSYVFRAAYTRTLSTLGPALAHGVWVEFLQELLAREAYVEARHELAAIEATLGADVITDETRKVAATLAAREDEAQEEFAELLRILAATHEPGQLVTVCRTFLDRHPRTVVALKALQGFLADMGRDEDAVETAVQLGVAQLQHGQVDEAEATFLDVVEQVPHHGGAALGVFACMLVRGDDAVPDEDGADYPRDGAGLAELAQRQMG